MGTSSPIVQESCTYVAHFSPVPNSVSKYGAFYSSKVGIFQAAEGEEGGKTFPDPFFGGEGPQRTTCIQCGGCMMGCRHGAKNTLDLGYLYLAEKYGARVFPETRVVNVKPMGGIGDGSAGYEVCTV